MSGQAETLVTRRLAQARTESTNVEREIFKLQERLSGLVSRRSELEDILDAMRKDSEL